MKSDYSRKSIAPTDDDALTGGHWEQRGLTQVWVSDTCLDCGDPLKPGERCDTCLTWAVKNARDFEWRRISWENRSVIWDVLEQRSDKQEAA